MKKTLFLFIINCCLLQISIAQEIDDAKDYLKYFKEGKVFYAKEDFLTANDRFKIALRFTQDETKIRELNDWLNRCRDKIKAQKSKIDKKNEELITSNDSVKKVLKIAKDETVRADMAVNSNNLQLYYYNSRDFATKSKQFSDNKEFQALFSIYSYKMIDFGNKKYGKYHTIKSDNTVKEALIETYLDNFGKNVDTCAAYTVNSYKNVVLQCYRENNKTKIKLSKISNDPITQKIKLTNSFVDSITGNNLITQSVFLSDNKFALATSSGNILLNTGNKIDTIYNCGVRINDLKFDSASNSLLAATIDNKIIIYNLSSNKKDSIKLGDFIYNLNIINSSVIIYNTQHNLHILNLYTKNHDSIAVLDSNYISKMNYNKQKSLLFAGIGNRIYVFDSLSEVNYTKVKPTILNVPHKGEINFLYFDIKTNKLISSDWTGEIMLWDFSADSTENISYPQPVVIETNKKNYAFSFNEMLNTLFFVDQKNTDCIPFTTDLLFKALRNYFNDPKMTDGQWKNYIKGNIEIPDEKN